MIDTADSYMARAEGHSGGESETVIGRWLARRGRRDDVFIATKVGSWAERKGLAPDNIRAACDDSLRRLQTDHIDLYYAHRDDFDTPQEEYLAAFDELVRAGKVRAIGASNFEADRLRRRPGDLRRARPRAVHRRPAALQPRRARLRGRARAAGRARGPRLLPLLRAGEGLPDGQVPARGRRRRHGRGRGRWRAPVPRVRGATWTTAGSRCSGCSTRSPRRTTCRSPRSRWRGSSSRPTVAAPIASARTPAQLREILPTLTLQLSDDELERSPARDPAAAQ